MGNSVQTMPSSEAVTRKQWKWTAVASMANYIDAGSIVAGASGLSIWATQFHMSNSLVGVLGAFSSNAISAGVGALIGGRICDVYGRKKIYTWDLLVYSFGILWIIFAVKVWMLIVGYIVVGLAVGADVPASWTLIAELAPSKSRGKMSGFAQVLWNLGPVITLLLALFLSPLGVLGVRLLFVHLLIVAVITWALRRGVVESERWKRAVQVESGSVGGTGSSRRVLASSDLKQLLSNRVHLGGLVFCIVMYGLWNLVAGTNGFFLPYILHTVGSESQATSVELQCFNFLLTVLSTLLVFMPLNDRVNRRWLFAISAVLQVIAFLLFVLFDLNTWIALINVILYGIGFGFGQQPFFQLWSGELFPTKLRSTAQGFMFAVVRIGLGLWSFFVPILTATGFHTLALILTMMLVVSSLVGLIFAPRTEGKTLEEIELERTGNIHRTTAPSSTSSPNF
ncbi:MFS transporter [Alicyclobacillus kakegawensis]|uniref:MFS transporter n=1 Tax=Alicyclobacillus kakegawensis TaxID=392012 RepID=UPI000ADDC577|nr:MFS transporter [Alicyclobacillus kakegawensis]